MNCPIGLIYNSISRRIYNRHTVRRHHNIFTVATESIGDFSIRNKLGTQRQLVVLTFLKTYLAAGHIVVEQTLEILNFDIADPGSKGTPYALLITLHILLAGLCIRGTKDLINTPAKKHCVERAKGILEARTQRRLGADVESA